MFLLQAASRFIFMPFNSFSEPLPQEAFGRTTLNQSELFDTAIQSIQALFKSFQEKELLEDKQKELELLHHEITHLRDTALQDRREVLLAHRHLTKKELRDLDLSELRRGRAMEAQIEAIMQQATTLIDDAVNLQFSRQVSKERKQVAPFFREAKKLLDITASNVRFEREWDWAKGLYTVGFREESLVTLKKIPLPSIIQKIFTSIIQVSAKEDLDLFFQFAEQAGIRGFLQNVTLRVYQPTTLFDVLAQETILHVFLQYANPVPLMRVHSSFHNNLLQKLPHAFMTSQAKKAQDLRSFSLSTAPIVCKDIIATAVAALTHNGLEYENLHPRLQEDIGIIKIALLSITQKRTQRDYQKLVALFPENIQKKVPEFLREMTLTEGNQWTLDFQEKKEASYIKFLAKEYVCKFPNDRDICRLMVQISSLHLYYTSAAIQNDPEIVLLAVQQEDGYALQFASERLKDNETIVMTAVKENGRILFSASEQMKDNKKIVLAAVSQNGCALSSASTQMKDTHEIVMTAVKEDGAALSFASNRLKDNEAIVIEAIKQYVLALGHASERLRDNDAIIMAAIKRNWFAFVYASERLKDTEAIAMAAIQQNGEALFYASDRLKKTEHVVLAAVSQNWEALLYVNTPFLDNETIIVEAMKQNRDALKYASERLRKKLK